MEKNEYGGKKQLFKRSYKQQLMERKKACLIKKL